MRYTNRLLMSDGKFYKQGSLDDICAKQVLKRQSG